MGVRGPTPKPNELKALEGNPSKRQIGNTPKVELSDNSKRPPAYLGTYAKKEWKRILPLLERNKLVTDTDYIALSAYCQAVNTWILAEKEKRLLGLTCITEKGNKIQAPAVGIANTAMTQILKFGREFGLTPSSRQQFNVEDFDDSQNPLLKIMKRQNEIRSG